MTQRGEAKNPTQIRIHGENSSEDVRGNARDVDGQNEPSVLRGLHDIVD